MGLGPFGRGPSPHLLLPTTGPLALARVRVEFPMLVLVELLRDLLLVLPVKQCGHAARPWAAGRGLELGAAAVRSDWGSYSLSLGILPSRWAAN